MIHIVAHSCYIEEYNETLREEFEKAHKKRKWKNTDVCRCNLFLHTFCPCLSINATLMVNVTCNKSTYFIEVIEIYIFYPFS